MSAGRALRVAMWAAVACGSPHVAMRPALYTGGAKPPPPVDAAAATFALPASGAAVGAGLANERGRMLGYAEEGGCAGRCLGLEDYPGAQPDLDTFDARVDDTAVRVGARRAGAVHPVATSWIPWLRTGDAEREADVRDEQQPPVAPIAIAAAAARPVGSYAIIQGSIVRATFDVPRVCVQAGCGACAAGAPAVTGVRGDRANVPGLEAQTGVFLLQRTAAGGFAVIARISSGDCSG